MIVPNPIRAAQRALGLEDRDALFATLLNVTERDLQAAREGDTPARDRLVEAASLVLGIEPHELIFDGPEGRASTALFKTVSDPLHESAFREAAHQRLQRDLGRFVRRLRRKAWLRAVLGEAAPELPPEVAALAVPTPPDATDTLGGDRLAVQVRQVLGLGHDPIPSMLALVRDRLQVEVHVNRRMWGHIDGASYAVGAARGVLVNLRERRSPRRVRMTLAHELCHVLFDGGFAGAARGGMLAFSPRGEGASGASGRASFSVEVFVRREQRAGSFAAYLIAPPDGVRARFRGDHPPKSRETVDDVAEHFGLSRTAALNVVANVFGWKPHERLDVYSCFEDAPDLRRDAWEDDRLREIGRRDEELRRLADRAVQQRRLSPAERMRYVRE